MDRNIEMMTIELSNGGTAFIDDEDLEKVKMYKWYKIKDHNVHYAMAHFYNTDGKRSNLSLHRLITNAKKGQIVDHVNRDGLNNCKSNLRFSDCSQNSANRIKMPHAIYSKFKGVSWSKRNNMWVARICSKKGKYARYFHNENDAAIAWNIQARLIYGEFALLNEVSH